MKHGHLTVVREVERDAKSIRRYECLCECGNNVVLRSNHFYPWRQYCSRSCHLLKANRMLDLSGKVFGKWTVAGLASGDKRSSWHAKCECGYESVINGASLVAGQSKSCRRCANAGRRSSRTKEEWILVKRERARLSNRKNPARVKANKIKYESKLRKATPAWLTKEDWDQMNAVYQLARKLTLETGIRHEVDHIFPIAGKTVSGLHVPSNLQILTQVENVIKSNRYADLSGD